MSRHASECVVGDSFFYFWQTFSYWVHVSLTTSKRAAHNCLDEKYSMFRSRRAMGEQRVVSREGVEIHIKSTLIVDDEVANQVGSLHISPERLIHVDESPVFGA